MRYIIHSLKKSRRYFLLIGLLCIASPFAAILTSSLMGRMTDHFAQYGLIASGTLIFLTITAYITEEAFEFLYHDACGRLQAYVYSAMQEKSFLALRGLSADDPILRSSGDLYQRFANDTNEVTDFFSAVAPEILMQSSCLVITLIYLFAADWRMAGIYSAAAVCSVAVQGAIGRIMRQAGKNVKNAEVKMNESLQNLLGGRLILKVYGADCFARKHCEAGSQNLIKARVRQNILAMPLRTAGILCGMVPILSICMAGLYMIPKGMLSTGTFLSVFYLCRKIVPKQLHYVDLLVSAVKTKPAAHRMCMLWQAEPRERCESDETGTVCEYGRNSANTEDGDIVCREVWYRYPEQEDWTVRGVSLDIPSGRKVAFVGESGSGKSTVLKLLSGLLHPQKGEISAPDAVINRQFPHLFSATIRENVAFGRTGDENADGGKESDAAFRRACAAAELEAVAAKAEQGMETELWGNGQNVSGGQRQRIAVARTVYSDAPILLFDESVSALDSETAQKVVKQILSDHKNTTILMVLHQKELLPFFDEVYTFDKGKIVDRAIQKERRKENQ